MDENTEENPRDGNNILSSSGTRQNNQTLPNDTMNRTADRTCTQKLTVPTLEKHDHTSANLWWRKFVQYIKMTKEIDLSTMTNNKEILTQYRDQLETEIKDIFIWAIGQNAITEMTKTIRERDRAHYHCINFTHFSDYTSHRKGTYNIVEPISST